MKRTLLVLSVLLISVSCGKNPNSQYKAGVYNGYLNACYGLAKIDWASQDEKNKLWGFCKLKAKRQAQYVDCTINKEICVYDDKSNGR